MRARSGVTLVEVLVAMLIAGALSAIALPTFLGLRLQARNAEARTAVEDAWRTAGHHWLQRNSFAGLDSTDASGNWTALIEKEPSLSGVPQSNVSPGPSVNPRQINMYINYGGPRPASYIELCAVSLGDRTYCITAFQASDDAYAPDVRYISERSRPSDAKAAEYSEALRRWSDAERD